MHLFCPYSLLAKISFPLRPRSASSLVIPTFNKVIDATLLIHIDNSFPLMSPFLNILLSSLPHLFPVPRSYLYLSSFPFRISHMSPQLLHFDCYRFILVACVPTPSLQMTHLLWRHPPRHRSYRLSPILLSPFRKVLVPLVILILFIIYCLIIVYVHHIMFLFPPCLLFLFLTPLMRPSLIQVENRQ